VQAAILRDARILRQAQERAPQDEVSVFEFHTLDTMGFTESTSVATPTFLSVIPGRRSEAEANPESIPTVETTGLWIPGSG